MFWNYTSYNLFWCSIWKVTSVPCYYYYRWQAEKRFIGNSWFTICFIQVLAGYPCFTMVYTWRYSNNLLLILLFVNLGKVSHSYPQTILTSSLIIPLLSCYTASPHWKIGFGLLLSSLGEGFGLRHPQVCCFASVSNWFGLQPHLGSFGLPPRLGAVSLPSQVGTFQ